MRVLVQSELPCHADHAWAEVQTLALLRLAPPARDATLPDRWADGDTVALRTYLFGAIPLGTRTLHWERINPAEREMQTREYDPLIRRWDHRIHVEPLAAGRCRYTDDVEVQAGLLTLPVWLFAQWFYRHRQWRWRRVARRLQAG